MIAQTLIHLCILLFSTLYPLYRSVRVYRQKESEQIKLRLLKFWVINCLVYLIRFYFGKLLTIVEVQEGLYAILYFSLVIYDFQVSEFIYDRVVQEGVHG